METNILHVSDTHLGKNQYGSDIRVDDYARAFDVSISIAIEENVDAVVHTGDLFDSRSPNTRTISQAFDILARLNKHNIPFYGLVGNHERKWDKQWMDIFENLENVHRLSEKPHVVNGKVALYGFDSFRGVEWENSDFELEKPDEDNIAVLLCMHELFEELIPPHKAKRSIIPVLDNINIEPDAIALGDYHASIDKDIKGVSTFYAGATERTSASTGDPTVRIIKFKDNKLDEYPWRKINTVEDNVPRPFYIVDIELKDDSSRSFIRQRVLDDVPKEDLNNSVVVVNLTGSNESSVTPSEVYSVLEQHDVPVPYVNNKRVPENMNFNPEEVSSEPTDININEMIDERIGDVSDMVKNIESSIVRDETVSKTGIRDIVSEEVSDKEGDLEWKLNPLQSIILEVMKRQR